MKGKKKEKINMKNDIKEKMWGEKLKGRKKKSEIKETRLSEQRRKLLNISKKKKRWKRKNEKESKKRRKGLGWMKEDNQKLGIKE